MISIPKSRSIILIILTLLTIIIGCSKPDLSEVGNDITCYAATYSKGIYKSDNGGISWYPLDMDQEDLYLYFKKIFPVPDDKKKFYITTTGAGLFIIDPEAGSMDSVNQFKDEIVRGIVFRNVSIGKAEVIIILVGMSDRGIFNTIEDEENWEPFNKGLTYRDVNTLLVRDKDIYAGTINDLFRWDDASGEWKTISEGIKNKNIISIDANSSGDTLYAGAGYYDGIKGWFESIPCLYKSTDKGQTWEASDRGLPDGTLIYTIAINSNKPERIYLGTSDGIFRSTNSGKKWTEMENGLPEESRFFDIKIIHLADDKDLVYAAGSSGVFMTLDDNKSPWVNRSYGLERTNITCIVLVKD